MKAHYVIGACQRFEDLGSDVFIAARICVTNMNSCIAKTTSVWFSRPRYGLVHLYCFDYLWFIFRSVGQLATAAVC